MKYIKEIIEEVEAFQWNGTTLEDAKEFAKQIDVTDYAIGSDGIKTGFVFYNNKYRRVIEKGNYLIKNKFDPFDISLNSNWCIMNKEEFERQYIPKDC
jgi:hypothetical protein